ncbi:hypothetical protein [Muribaculum intestinale]|jgi:hypothetical protein|uniref:hypothetical protein n=1 Tax=Muribaculum intestinale TaxID=1796646 RepID=UPI0025B1EA3B|nr:hypothetical protein [Muribaculum intestinale]
MNRFIILLPLVLAIGCRPRYNENPPLSPLEIYKNMNDWVELDSTPYPKITFLSIGADTLNYTKAVRKYGVPVYEFFDTVIHGNNIKTDLPDYDLYPITLERDTVYVRRCWWFLSYRRMEYLYLVFEEHTDSLPAIYGYIY